MLERSKGSDLMLKRVQFFPHLGGDSMKLYKGNVVVEGRSSDEVSLNRVFKMIEY